ARLSRMVKLNAVENVNARQRSSSADCGGGLRLGGGCLFVGPFFGGGGALGVLDAPSLRRCISGLGQPFYVLSEFLQRHRGAIPDIVLGRMTQRREQMLLDQNRNLVR